MKKSRQVLAAWWGGWMSSMGVGSCGVAEGSEVGACSAGGACEVSTWAEMGCDAGDGSGF
jgi:hypothetical protein